MVCAASLRSWHKPRQARVAGEAYVRLAKNEVQMSIYAIGDIHGNYYLLSKAIAYILRSADLNKDKIVLLGDVIDIGEESKDCVDLILKKGKEIKIIALMGNHEEWMLQTKSDYTKHSWIISMEGLKTIKSYSEYAESAIIQKAKETGMDLFAGGKELPYGSFFHNIPKDHLAFYESMENYYEEEGCIFSHAGIAIDGIMLSEMDERGFKWGFPGFPNKYKGEKTVVYGHWSKNAKIENGKVVPFVKNRTICIDTSTHNELMIFKSPENKVIHIK